MKRIAKRQFFLLGCASLAAMLLSLYDRYGIVLTSSSRSFLAEQSQLQEQVLRENQEKGGNRSTGQSGKESKTMAENKAGAETETAEKDERHQMQIRTSVSCCAVTIMRVNTMTGSRLRQMCRFG